MRVTILGSGAAYPRPGGACTGLLFSSETTNLWVDAGNGTFSRLREHISFGDLDALVCTHAHGDHIADVLPLMYALHFDGEGAVLPVHATDEVRRRLETMLGPVSGEMFRKVFDHRELGRPFEVGDLSVEPFRTEHPLETYGLRVRHEGKLAVFTSDTAVFDGLAEACRGADLLIAEATFVGDVEVEAGIHLRAREAGEVAQAAGAGTLVLTHVWPTFDVADAVAEAARAFDGPVEAAVEGRVHEV